MSLRTLYTYTLSEHSDIVLLLHPLLVPRAPRIDHFLSPQLALSSGGSVAQFSARVVLVVIFVLRSSL